MVSTLVFSQVDNVYESADVRFANDTVLELNFDSIPELTGVNITIKQSLTKSGWQTCFSDTLRHGLTWCRTLQGVSENAWYKVVCTTNPQSANYE